MSIFKSGLVEAGPVSSVSVLDETLDVDRITSVMAVDPRNQIRALTITLKPVYHSVNPRKMRKHIVDETKSFICKCKTPLFCELDWEFTSGLILHAHGYAIGRKTTLARLSAMYRSFGYTCVKTPDNLRGWQEYCKKEQVYGTNRLLKIDAQTAHVYAACAAAPPDEVGDPQGHKK